MVVYCELLEHGSDRAGMGISPQEEPRSCIIIAKMANRLDTGTIPLPPVILAGIQFQYLLVEARG